MDWLNRLLGTDAPAGTSLRAAELHLRGGVPAWAVTLFLIAFAALSFVLYFRERLLRGWWRPVTMALLRTAALGLLLGLLLRPVLVTEFAGERPRPVAVLLDTSQSMRQQDRRVTPADRQRVAIARGQAAPDAPPDFSAANEADNPSRADLVRAVLENPSLALLDRLQSQGPLRTYLFGNRLRSVPAAELAAFSADEPRTALADALADLLSGREGDPPAAVVLVTDGQDNASKLPLDEAAKECARLGVPVHVYGVGSTEAGMIQVADAGLPDTLFYDDFATVPVRWRAQGFKDGTAIVTLALGGRTVARKEFPLRSGESVREVLSFTPEKRAGEREERQDLAVTVTVKENPTYADTLKKPVQLLDRKVKVLVVEGPPRWEYKFLQPVLLRDRRVEASFLPTAGDPRALSAGPPYLTAFPDREGLFGYDLLILGDVPAGYFGPDQLTLIQDFVREGGGLVVIAGRMNMPSSFVESALAEVLPVEFLPAKFPPNPEARTVAFIPVRTPAGERSGMLTLADTPDEDRRVWRDLPGFYWHYPVTKLRPGATALLVHPARTAGDQPMPVLASQYYGKGQVLFLAGDETWRWRYNAGDKLYSRLWGQIVYQTGLPHLLGNARRVQLALERSEVVLGRPGSVYARLLDAEYRPLADAKVPATLESLDPAPGAERTRAVTLEAVPGRPGEYRALLPHDAPGRFELKVGGPEPATLGYRVQLPPHHEMEPAGLAEGPLRELAAATGGGFYREEDLHRLAASVVPKSVGFTHRQEVLLWNPLALVLFVVLVTAEWVMRKLANLS